jgi:hypothetical protein
LLWIHLHECDGFCTQKLFQTPVIRTRRLKDDQRVWLQTYPLEQLCMAGLVVGEIVVSAVC